ncbi:hypothetical protein APHAL10511_007662 [Amanita phalloides]|nr:hypothetical protein APHAL10511_007662 [Amanita phalloides]
MAASSSLLRSQLLRCALFLVKDHGFTRQALARSVLSHSTQSQHKEPLTDEAVTALFGEGDEARRTLIRAWLDEGLNSMRASPQTTLPQVLHARLAYNEPALSHIPEAFALLISPSTGVPPLDPLPAVRHVAKIADEACRAAQVPSLQMVWYTNRASVAAVYAAAELHQLTSPTTAHAFLDSLLESSTAAKKSIEEVGTYSDFIIRSWAGIIKSWGVL